MSGEPQRSVQAYVSLCRRLLLASKLGALFNVRSKLSLLVLVPVPYHLQVSGATSTAA